MTEIAPDTPVVTIGDPGFAHGAGAFETIGITDGHPQALEEHLQRLASSARRLRLPELNIGQLLSACRHITSLLPKSGEQFLRVVYTPGPDFGPSTAGSSVGAVYVQAGPRADCTKMRTTGLSVSLLSAGRSSGDAPLAPWLLLDAKTLSFAPHAAVRAEASRRGDDDALLVTTDGLLTEASTANVILRLNGIYTTPDPVIGLLPGITQRRLFRALAAAGEATEVRGVRAAELIEADGVWLTSSLRQVVPVRAVDGTDLVVPPGQSARLNTLLAGRP